MHFYWIYLNYAKNIYLWIIIGKISQETSVQQYEVFKTSFYWRNSRIRLAFDNFLVQGLHIVKVTLASFAIRVSLLISKGSYTWVMKLRKRVLSLFIELNCWRVVSSWSWDPILFVLEALSTWVKVHCLMAWVLWIENGASFSKKTSFFIWNNIRVTSAWSWDFLGFSLRFFYFASNWISYSALFRKIFIGTWSWIFVINGLSERSCDDHLFSSLPKVKSFRWFWAFERIDGIIGSGWRGDGETE